MSALLPRLLGSAFARLPAAVRRVHGGECTEVFKGGARIERGIRRSAKAFGWLSNLPPAGEVPLVLEFARSAQGEAWTRDFGAHRMRSRLWADGELLRERLGVAQFGFNLRVDAGQLLWQLVAARGLFVPLPLAWFAATSSRVYEDDGRYCFDVQSALPGAGLIVRYRGWLDVD